MSLSAMRPTLPDHGQAILLLDVPSRECTGEQYEAQRKVWSALKNETAPPKSHSSAGAANHHCLVPGVHSALQAAFDRGGNDVGRGNQGSPLRRALRDGVDL